MKTDINLNNEYIMTIMEAANRYNVSKTFIRKHLDDLPKRTKRKFGIEWLVTERGMNAITDQNKVNNFPSKEKIKRICLTFIVFFCQKIIILVYKNTIFYSKMIY